MLNSFFQAICRVGIFMICAQAIVHFRPKESYEKYLKLLVSAMILVQLFWPFGSFLLGVGGQDAAQALEQFKREMEQAAREAEENAAAADALLEQMTLEELKSRVEEQKREAAEDVGKGTGNEMEEKDPTDYGRKTSGAGEASIEIDLEMEAVEPVRIETAPPAE